MTLSLILPCYNPPMGWEQNVVARYNMLCAHTGAATELVIVFDGGSATATQQSKDHLSQQVSNLKLITYTENRGKGYAIREGVRAASGGKIMYTDVDFPYTESSMLEVYRELSNGNNDVVIGVKDEAYYSHVPAARKSISKLLRSMSGFFLSLPITDTQCGLKGFTEQAKNVFLQTTIDRYLFDLEFVRNAFRNKLRVKAVPVSLNEHVHFRKMNFAILLPEMINFVRLLFKRNK